MIRVATLAFALASLSAQANAQTPAGSLAMAAAELRQSVTSPVYGGLLGKAVFVGEENGCAWVGVVLGGSANDKRARIENFTVCNGQVLASNEVSPALPDDWQFRQTAASTIRAAIMYGTRTSDWQGYRIAALRLTKPDARTCALVETTVSYEGLLVSNNSGRICYDQPVL